MEYNIAVCDDDPADRGYIASLARSWASERGMGVRVTEFPTAESLLFALEDGRFDILLLDIQMPGMDGVELAKSLRREDETAQIVFVTGYSQYIEEGYEVAALHFLIKPVGPEKLARVLDRAARNLRKAERVLTLEVSGQLARLPLRQITFAEVRGNYVTVHAGEDYTVKMTLSELENRLDERFLRVGRSFAVNLTLISKVTRKEIVLTDGASVPLPRGAYETVNRAILTLEGTHGTV